jgi:hypothetical protein
MKNEATLNEWASPISVGAVYDRPRSNMLGNLEIAGGHRQKSGNVYRWIAGRAAALAVFVLLTLISDAAAKSGVAGDIIVIGAVQRSGRALVNDTIIFEGDTIQTRKGGAGIIRFGRGRLEIDEDSEIEVVAREPLKIRVRSGTVAYNFPAGAWFEIVTPQLEVRPLVNDSNMSGSVSAQPGREDRVESRHGEYAILEREPNGAANRIKEGQTLVASLVPLITLPTATAAPQGPLGGPQIAIIESYSGDVRVTRAATPNNAARVTAVGLPLASNDTVRTLAGGNADIRFTDNALITLTPGTIVQIQQQQTPAGISRRISQFLGSIWFSIQRVTGTETTLQTPTAVAAIRGTEGAQDVPNEFQSVHALNEGVQEITEIVTQQTVTIRGGQRVTAIRGVGFTPIVALLAAIPKPGGGGAPGVAPGVTGGAVAAAGTAAGAAAASTVSTVASTVIPTVSQLATIAAVPLATREKSSASGSQPQLPPGGQ